jgi:hypothetical protein
MLEKGAPLLGFIGVGAVIVLPSLYAYLAGSMAHPPAWPILGIIFGSAGLIGAGTARFKTVPVYVFLGFSIFGICLMRGLLQLGATDQQEANNRFFIGGLFLGVPFSALMIWICSRLQPWYVRYLLPFAVILMSFAIAIASSRS